MDLLTEASSGTRVLTARHINPDKMIPEINGAINTTFLCHTYSLNPDFNTYYSGLRDYAWPIWGCGVILLVVTWLLYGLTLRSALKHWSNSRAHVSIVLSVYPLVSGAAFIAVLIPRARVISEAIAQEVVMIALYHFFCLMIAECGGPEQLIRRASGSHLETRVPPCCCWPCCVIPRPKLQKQNMELLRYLVLQMPIVQAFIYTMILVLWAEDFALYHNKFVFFQPFIAASILSGVWGVVMCVRTITELGYRPKPRFLVVQFVLIIVKLQCGLAKVLADAITLPCVLSLHPSIFVNLIQNSLMMLEMLLLSLLAWRLYSVPPGKDVTKVQRLSIAVLEDNVRAIDVKSQKEGIDNKSYNNNHHISN